MTPDSGKTVLRSRFGQNYGQLPASERGRESLPAAEIVCKQNKARWGIGLGQVFSNAR
jgi:hypothetical protein